jgi:AhpD family alkylhydroperoxidase
LERISQTAGSRREGIGSTFSRYDQGLCRIEFGWSKKNLLGAKTRELIALAVAVTLRCGGCITVHTEAAIKNGATKDEIAEAFGVATTVNAGAALVYSARAMDTFTEYPRASS